MPSTYDSALSTNKDKVRRLVGDTAAPFEFSDEEIDWFLSDNNDRLLGAAADVLDAWASKNIFVKPTSYLRGGIQVTRTPSIMLEQAARMRERDINSVGEVWTEFAHDHFSLERILADRALTNED